MTPERLKRLDGVLRRRQPDLTLIAENLHKPRNLSAVVRTCDSVGVEQVHVVPGKERPRHFWHTSQGAEKWVRLNIHESAPAACEHVKAEGFTVLAAHLSEQAVDYREFDYTQPVALLIGTEAFGVSEQGLAHADQQIVIPMMGMSQSLNVSVASAVVLFEAMEQRRRAGMYEHSRMDQKRYKQTRFEWLHPVLARYCKEKGLRYPDLDEDGSLLSDPREPAGPLSATVPEKT